MKRIVFGLALAALMGSNAMAKPEMTNWQVLTTFKDKGDVVCQIRFAAQKGMPSLSIENRTTKGESKQQAFVQLGNLPPYFEAQKTPIRDIAMRAGSWSVGDIKATWQHGDEANNSKLTFTADATAETVFVALTAGGQLQIDVPMANKVGRFWFDLTDAQGPVGIATQCLALRKAK